MKIKTLFILFLSITSISSFNCTKEEKSINAFVNDTLEGFWHANRIFKDGNPYGGPVEHFKFSFQPNENEGGTTIWTSYIFTAHDYQSYQVINDGTEIDIDGRIFQLRKLTSDEIILHGNPSRDDYSLWKIHADKVP